jgi:hypothetical protein
MERARLKIRVSLSILLVLLLVGIPAMAQSRAVVFDLTTLDSFDDEDGQQWAVSGSKFINAEYPQTVYVNAYPEALFGRYLQGADQKKALGIRAAWDRKGYNYIEIVPVAPDAGGDLVPTPIPIRGRASRLDVWMWGGNYNYYAEVHLQDYRGVPHRLFLGDLTFTGWKNLSILIPSAIPQNVRWIPSNRPLSITKFVIWTRPEERVDDFFIYIDELKVMADVAEDRFDGDQLAQPSFLEEAWKDARKQGE